MVTDRRRDESQDVNWGPCIALAQKSLTEFKSVLPSLYKIENSNTTPLPLEVNSENRAKLHKNNRRTNQFLCEGDFV